MDINVFTRIRVQTVISRVFDQTKIRRYDEFPLFIFFCYNKFVR